MRQIYKNRNNYFTKSEKWNEKNMQTNNLIRCENGFKQFCKSHPKSNRNDPKLLPATVLKASWKHLGHHRAFYSKTLAGNSSFWGGLWVAFGALGYPKAPATLSHVTFWPTFLDQKSEKRHPKRASQNWYRKTVEKYAKRLPKLCQNGSTNL